MKVLVIPDVHLKPYMFVRAGQLMEAGMADAAVCLMDIPDDWNQKLNMDLYSQTFDAAIDFAKRYPETKWCFGNHDLSYLWGYPETGFSAPMMYVVGNKLGKLRATLAATDNDIQYVQRIDDVIFSHAGVSDWFVKEKIPGYEKLSIDKTIEAINELEDEDIWSDYSPIWLRPQGEYNKSASPKMWHQRKLLQVVGHSPVEQITREHNKNVNIISCDVFSTYRDGRPIGTQEFLLLDTITWEYAGVR